MIDFCLKEEPATINNEIDLIKQQIELLFDTDKMEVLGGLEFGTHYEEFLYDLSIGADAIADKISADMNTLNLFGYVHEVKVDLYQGTENDIILVHIYLKKDEIYELIIKIS